MDFIKKNAKFIAIGGCILGIIGCFLAFATASVWTISESVTFVSGSDGKLVIALLVASGVLVYFKKSLISLVTTGAALGITIYDAIDVKSKFSGYGSLVKVNFGVGFYIVLVGIIVAAVATFLCYKAEQNK